MNQVGKNDRESCKWYSERSQLHRRKAKDVAEQIKYSSQNRREQNRAEQNRTEQNRTEQSRREQKKTDGEQVIMSDVLPVLIASFTMGQSLSASSQ